LTGGSEALDWVTETWNTELKTEQRIGSSRRDPSDSQRHGTCASRLTSSLMELWLPKVRDKTLGFGKKAQKQ
jgi:hypothetical protein